MVHKVGGSITVFLSFILVMILALIGTLLDVARIHMADSFSYRALVSAVDTQFTKYCSELYQDYHIYMLENGKNPGSMSGEEFMDSVSEYLMCTFDADDGIGVLGTKAKVNGTDLLELTASNCKREGLTTLTDYDAKIFQDQIAQYMKYYVGSEAADGILEKLSLMKQSGETMTVVRKKNEVDEEVSKIDKKLMSLMEEVEGIRFKDDTLQVNKDYTVKVHDSFAKQFYTGSKSSVASTINHNVIWDSLKDSYINPVSELEDIKKDIKTYKESCNSKDKLTQEIESLSRKIIELKNKIAAKQLLPTAKPVLEPEETIAFPTVPPKEEKDPDQEELEKKEKELKKKQEELKKNDKKLVPLVKQIRKKSVALYKKTRKVHTHTEDAIRCVEGVREARDSSEGKLKDFEGTLTEYQSKIPADSYQGIKEEYEETKRYVKDIDKTGKDTSMVGTALAMKERLEMNKKVLEQAIEVTASGAKITGEQLDQYKERIDGLQNTYGSYSIKELRFDYSTLKIEEDVESPLDSFGSLIEDGILGLVVDNEDKLSKESLDKGSLISKGQGKEADVDADQENNEDLADKLKDQDTDAGVDDNLQNYEEACKSARIEDSTANDLIRKFLINEYGVTNFKNLGDELGKGKKEDQKQKETKLSYEQEYLVIGSCNDLDNVKSIVMRTIFMRTAVNYLSLLTNSKCRAQAKATAACMVGFTGFAPLIAIVQQLILIAWAFEEGLVDCRALLDGNSVPFIKRANQFAVTYKDLLVINKQTIKKKAEKYKGKSGLASVSYNDYLRIYMLLVPQDTLSYRMMDLMQENMRLRYDPKFTMANGIFGVKVSMDVSMPGKFLSIPFVKDFAGYDGSEFTFHVSTEYSY